MSSYLKQYKIQHNAKINKWRIMELVDSGGTWIQTQIYSGVILDEEFGTYEEAFDALTTYDHMAQEKYDRELNENWVDI